MVLASPRKIHARALPTGHTGYVRIVGQAMGRAEVRSEPEVLLWKFHHVGNDKRASRHRSSAQ
jgi:hypothetical protein